MELTPEYDAGCQRSERMKGASEARNQMTSCMGQDASHHGSEPHGRGCEEIQAD